MSNQRKLRLTVVVAALAFVGGCSDPREAPTSGPGVSVHPAGWNVESSAGFHGSVLEANAFDASECRVCHGNEYDGGLVGVSCKDCHASFPHPEGWTDPGANFHGRFFQSNGYDLAACQECHGQNYAVVKTDTSCLTCHTQPAGPEACNTCHGNFSGDGMDLLDVAPPEGLNGETDPATRPVGAHVHHLTYNPSRPVAETCRECHVLPMEFADATHIDGTPGAELVFGGTLGSLPTEGGIRTPVPSYDPNGVTCSNTYCHGNWGLLESQSGNGFIYSGPKMEGNSASPDWTEPATAACGSCHDLPPTGHNPASINACSGCHEDVVDDNGLIIDTTKHVNGMVNVFGSEYPMF